MKTLILLLTLLGSELFALSLDELIEKSLNSHPSLASMQQRIEVNKESIAVSNQFANPVLTYAQNTLDSSEKMSQKTLTLSQKIYFYGKRDAQEGISLADEKILTENLEEAKVRLVEQIKQSAYQIWELEALYEIICQYEELTKQNIELSESYTSTSPNQHMGIMSAELTLSDLQIQKSALKAKIKSTYAQLSYLSNVEVSTLDIDLKISNLPTQDALSSGLKNNHEILLKEREILKSSAKITKAEVNNYPDINLVAGFAYRENFDNFANLGIGITLPIYGTEDSVEQEARLEKIVVEKLKEDKISAINSRFKQAYYTLESSFEIYHIINDTALPQLEHMFDLSNSSISTGGDLFKYIDILIQKLKLEQKSIAAIAAYYRASATISSLKGELK